MMPGGARLHCHKPKHAPDTPGRWPLHATACAAALLLAGLHPLAQAQPQTQAQAAALPTVAAPVARALAAPAEPNLLLLEVRLDGSLLADSLNAYELGDDVLLPLGELARLLTLGVSVDPATRSAAGFLVREDRGFRLDLQPPRVSLPGGAGEPVDPALLRWIDDDLYVAAQLLQRWWPLDLQLQLSSLTLRVLPRETLPIQARLARERAAQALRGRGGSPSDPGFDTVPSDYGLLSVPFIDQTLSLQLSRSADGRTTRRAAWSAYVTADLLGMEANLYLSSTHDQPRPDARLTLSRHDPAGQLLGPLQATSVSLGHVGVPALANVMRGAGSGQGLVLSNRPLNQPSSYGLHTLRGDLPPGWDVTLYFNDALIGFQGGRPDGRYEFDDQPLVFGRNEFRLVFNGPLGQTRVERDVFLLDQTLTKPGELFYTAGAQRGDDGSARRTLQFDAGLADSLAATAGLVSIGPAPGEATRHYTNLGLRASLGALLLSADHARGTDGGHLNEVGLRTGLGRFSLDATHTQLKAFVSDFYSSSSDPLRTRTRARITGSLLLGERLSLPLGLDLSREATASGRSSLNAQGRLSLNLMGTSLTNALNWQSAGGSHSAGGALQISRRVAGVGVSSQLAYTLRPDSQLASLALSADKSLDASSRVSLGMVRSFTPGQTTWSGGYNRNFGRFGLGVSARYAGKGDVGLGMQLFMALGRNPATGRWVQDWQPKAGAGTVLAQAFVDTNMNGRRDPGEEAIEGAGFVINAGSRHPARTDAQGAAYMSRLATRAYADIALDTGTLEDPQWQPLKPGVRVLPRPGKVLRLDFPVVMTGEVDGNVYLLEDDRPRGIGNAELELVTPTGEVAGTTRSGNDGYYILPAVKPGVYQVRINPAQLERLGLRSNPPVDVVMAGDGEFLNGVDFTLRKR